MLRDSADADFRDSQRRFSKEPIRSLGVRTADLRALAGRAASEYRSVELPMDDVLEIATRLWAGRYLEERVLGVLIVARFHRRLERRHWPRLDDLVSTLCNWGETDALCVEVLAPLLEKEPELIGHLSGWTRAESRWRRRAAAVSLVPLARRGKELEAVWGLADRLASDRDDMVEKALGWLLKEASRTQPTAVADYLVERSDRFSRTTLRYACEKLPAELRERVLSV